MPRSFAHTPIAARNTTNPTVPASAATPSLSVRPMATPMAKSNGRLAKIASPDAAMICDTIVWQPREVGAADAEQDAGDRQHRYRQHHALADFCRSEKAFLNDGIFISRLVRLANQCAHFRSGFGGERALRKLATFIETQFANLSFDRGNRRKTDAQFVDAEADQESARRAHRWRYRRKPRPADWRA